MYSDHWNKSCVFHSPLCMLVCVTSIFSLVQCRNKVCIPVQDIGTFAETLMYRKKMWGSSTSLHFYMHGKPKYCRNMYKCSIVFNSLYIHIKTCINNYTKYYITSSWLMKIINVFKNMSFRVFFKSGNDINMYPFLCRYILYYLCNIVTFVFCVDFFCISSSYE